LVVKGRIGAGLPPLTNEELAIHTAVWAEIVFGVIPESQLERAYARAMQDNADGFTLTAPKLVQGYRSLCASEASAPQLPQTSNLLAGKVCKKCFGSGMEQYVEGGYKQVRRCDHVVAEDDDSDIQNW
jgi:hypothetical protein